MSRPTQRRHETSTPRGRDKVSEVTEMPQRIRLSRPLLASVFLLALTGAMSVSATPFLCCRSGPTVAAAISQVPPIQAGLAPVWFLRRLQPFETLTSPPTFATAHPGPPPLPA